MRLFCGAACGRLKERKLGMSAVGRNCCCWRSGEGEKAGSVEEKDDAERKAFVQGGWEVVVL
jgi:hypothetical protein